MYILIVKLGLVVWFKDPKLRILAKTSEQFF